MAAAAQDALSLLLLLSPASRVEPSSKLRVCLPGSYTSLQLLLMSKPLALQSKVQTRKV